MELGLTKAESAFSGFVPTPSLRVLDQPYVIWKGMRHYGFGLGGDCNQDNPPPTQPEVNPQPPGPEPWITPVFVTAGRLYDRQ